MGLVEGLVEVVVLGLVEVEVMGLLEVVGLVKVLVRSALAGAAVSFSPVKSTTE